MTRISITYALVWQIKGFEYLKISRCKKVFNTKTNRMLKQVINGGSVGYWLNSKTFKTTKQINALSIKIDDIYCPF